MNSQNYLDEVRIKEAFVAMDTDKSGKLTVEEIKTFFVREEGCLDEEQISKLVDEVDVDKDGMISY